MNERKWWQPLFQLILLPNPAVDENWVYWHRLLQFILEMMQCVMFWPIYSLWMENLLNISTFLCAQIDFLFTIFICSLYGLWAPSFWLCLCATSRLCCMHFLSQWRKSLKGSMTLDNRKMLKKLSVVTKDWNDTEVSTYICPLETSCPSWFSLAFFSSASSTTGKRCSNVKTRGGVVSPTAL